MSVSSTAVATGVSESFWGEMAPCEHGLEVYANDAELIDSLEEFAAAGLEAGDGVIVIALPGHLRELHLRLGARDHFLKAIERDQYIPLDAESTLAEFMDDDWPDDARFREVVRRLLARARGHGRRVRAFGEMVAILWERGHNAATVRLEHLWGELCRSERLALLCAYPRSGFTTDPVSAVREICCAHSRLRAS